VKEDEAKPENGSLEADRERPIATVAAETNSSPIDNSGSTENRAAKAASATAASAQAGSPEAASPAADGEFNRALVVGVPLAAALLLVGVYWLILRAGAL
jgi:hypothetical protein